MRRRLLPLTLALGLASTLALADDRGADQMTYGETTRLDGFDPFTAPEAAAQRLSDLLFDSLVTLGPGGEYVPALARSWQIANGGLDVTFTLRDDVPWHPASAAAPGSPRGEASWGGSPLFGADDVVTTVRLLTASGSEIPNRERFSVLKGAEKDSDFKVTIHLRRALNDPLRACLFKILPAHVLGAAPALKRDSAFAAAPIGTGPYQFVKANAQGEVLLQANPKYFSGRPKISRIVMKAYADQSVMAQSLMFNSLDLVTDVGPRDLGEVAGDAKLTLVPYDALSYSFVAMNTQRGILKDRRVRQAIGHAINRQEMLDAFFQGKGRILTGPVPPTSWAYNADVRPLAFDLARAKALLAAAGVKDGKSRSLVFAVPLAGESEMIKRVVLAFQGYLEAAGLKVDLKFMDWQVWKKKVLDEHDYDLTIASWSFDDASNITSLFHSSSAKPWGNNFVLYSNPEVDSLLNEADATNDFDKRRAIYHKLHAILAEDAPYTYLWTLTHHAAHNTRLMGVRVEPFAFFKYVSTWQMEGGHGAH